MTELAALSGLFMAAFVAATILPAQSEAVLVGLIYTGHYAVWILVAVASVGNVLGSVVNWLLGRGIERFRNRPSALRQMVTAAQLGTDHRRPLNRGRWRDARTFSGVSSARHHRQGWSLRGAGERDVEFGVSVSRDRSRRNLTLQL